MAVEISVQEETKAMGFLRKIKEPEDGCWILTSLKSWIRYKLFSPQSNRLQRWHFRGLFGFLMALTSSMDVS